jgi:hypothetical protein
MTAVPELASATTARSTPSNRSRQRGLPPKTSLACMEVENSCRAILRANHYAFEDPKRPKTKDYWQLMNPLRLDAYRLTLVEYPTVAALRPFHRWEQANPTKSLPWYEAYNAKHSRELDFDQATLGAALHALAAGWALHAAQFGHEAFEHDSTMFECRKPPLFFTEYGYLCNMLGNSSTAVDYPFRT